MTFAVIRIRGPINTRGDIRATLRMLRLNQVNHCVLLPEGDASIAGMLAKAKDYITWGEVDATTLQSVISTYGRMIGNHRIVPELFEDGFGSLEDYCTAVVKGEAGSKDLPRLKPVFRLAPPKKGHKGGIKRTFKVGGCLGYRGEAINDLLGRMIAIEMEGA